MQGGTSIAQELGVPSGILADLRPVRSADHDAVTYNITPALIASLFRIYPDLKQVCLEVDAMDGTGIPCTLD